MKETRVFCDKCKKEVQYYLLPRYNVDDVLKDLVRRNVKVIEHLCDDCMKNLNNITSEAVQKWMDE